MPDRRRSNCRECEGHRDDVGLISWRGLCEKCATANVGENVAAMIERRGPNYERWLRRSYLATNLRLVALERERV